MSSQNPRENSPAPELDVVLRNTEALVRLEAAFDRTDKDLINHYAEDRARWMGLNSKIDNLDRSIQEMKFTLDHQETKLLVQFDEERKDRRAAVAENRNTLEQSDAQAHALVKRLLDEELASRRLVAEKETAAWTYFATAIKAVWEKGGQWVVAALCLYLVLAVRSCSDAGFDLAKILGLRP